MLGVIKYNYKEKQGCIKAVFTKMYCEIKDIMKNKVMFLEIYIYIYIFP